MKKLLLIFGAALLLASCNGKTSDSNKHAEEEAASDSISTQDLNRMWIIENVVLNDSVYVRPSEMQPDRDFYFTLAEDGSFGVNTNCNTIGGQYLQKGDSISFTNIFITEMACDDMKMEVLLTQILPEVNVVDVSMDSVIRLNTNSSAYIVLKKSPYKSKDVEPAGGTEISYQ